MGIQLDIEDVIAEVGVAFSIERMGILLDLDLEYLTYAANSQVTKPFVREHFLEVAFKSDTSVETGDIIIFVVSGDSYLVVNNTPDFFENEIIKKVAVLYKTNVLINIMKPQNTTVEYSTSFVFTASVLNVKALVYAPLFGNTMGVDADAGMYSLDKHELYLPDGYNLEEGDRIVIQSTSEKYQVDTIIPRRFPDIDVCSLSEDTRE